MSISLDMAINRFPYQRDASLLQHSCTKIIPVAPTSEDRRRASHGPPHRGANARRAVPGNRHRGNPRLRRRGTVPDGAGVARDPIVAHLAEAVARRALNRHDPPEAGLTATEDVLAAVYRRALNIPDIGIDDDVFVLGADSLRALWVIADVRERLGIELPLPSVFSHRTIRALSRAIEGLRGAAGAAATTPVSPVPRSGVLPLSSSQERVWFLHELGPASLAYSFEATLRFAGALDRGWLERSLSTIVRRHEIYRTTFHCDRSGRPHLVVHDALEPFPFTTVDLSDLPDGAQRAELDGRIGDEIRKAFQLDRLPLVRWTLYRLGDRAHVLLHAEHHLVHDGWSFNVLLSELLELYRAAAAGEPPDLPEVPLQFADFASWEKAWTATTEAAEQIEYWKRQLRGASSELNLPRDRSRAASFDFGGQALRVRLPEGTAARVRSLAQAEGVSDFTVFLAAFLAVLHRHGGDTEACVGVGVANRRRAETHGILGMLINTIVFRIPVAGDRTVRELLRDTWRVAVDGYARQECPLNEVVRAVGPKRVAGQNPLFQVMFSMHDSPLRNASIPDLGIELHEGLSNGAAKFDLNVIVIPPIRTPGSLVREGGSTAVTVNWEYRTDVFDPAAIERLSARYCEVLDEMVDAPEKRLGDLSSAPRR